MAEPNTLHRPDLRQIPECPVCHHNDQVKTAQEAYKGGVTRLVPPPLPKGTKTMMPWIVTGMAIYLCGNFYLLVQLGGGPGFSSWPVLFQVLEVVVLLCLTVSALVLSFIGFQRVVQADRETQWLYPVWDQVMDQWRGLFHCGRDDVVFRPGQRQVLSDEELRKLMALEPPIISSNIKAMTREQPASSPQEPAGENGEVTKA